MLLSEPNCERHPDEVRRAKGITDNLAERCESQTFIITLRSANDVDAMETPINTQRAEQLKTPFIRVRVGTRKSPVSL